MPQLDRVIIFSQIFWLFLIFTFLYIIITHFFLPKFLKSLKSRKQIIYLNDQERLIIDTKLKEQQAVLKKTIFNNLSLIEQIIKSELGLLDSKKKSLDIQLVDEKIANILINNSLYCDNQLLDSMVLFPKSLNLKAKLN